MKIKYATERNGEYLEFPLTSQYIILPNGEEYSLRYDSVTNGLTITKISDGELLIKPHVSNQITIR